MGHGRDDGCDDAFDDDPDVAVAMAGVCDDLTAEMQANMLTGPGAANEAAACLVGGDPLTCDDAAAVAVLVDDGNACGVPEAAVAEAVPFLVADGAVAADLVCRVDGPGGQPVCAPVDAGSGPTLWRRHRRDGVGNGDGVAAPAAATCPPAACRISTAFRLRDGWVYVVTDDSLSMRYLAAQRGITAVVALGSLQHRDAINERLIELQSRVSTLSAAAAAASQTPSAAPPGRAAMLTRAVARLRREIARRSEELVFLRSHCSGASVADSDDEPSRDDDDDDDDDHESSRVGDPRSRASSDDVTAQLERLVEETAVPLHPNGFVLESSATDSTLLTSTSATDLAGIGTASSSTDDGTATADDDEAAFGEVLHVTSETFGRVQRLRIYEIKRKERLFRRPKVRQYFIDSVLYRSNEEMRTSWLESFVDLLYTGVFSKAGALLFESQDWTTVNHLALLLIPLMQHWESFVGHVNYFFHEDLFHKIHSLIIMCSVAIMGNSLANAFNDDPTLNTSAIFLWTYIVSRLYMFALPAIVLFLFDRRFLPNHMPYVFLRPLALVPFAVVAAMPPAPNGSADALRCGLWWLGVVLEWLAPVVSVWTFRNFVRRPHRVAVNIEHMAERHGGLFAMAVAVAAVSFLVDFAGGREATLLGVVVLAIVVTACVAHLYFRAEGSAHYMHALRHKWYTGMAWMFVHYILFVGTISLGGIMSVMIAVEAARRNPTLTAEQREQRTALGPAWRDIFAVSLAVVFLCFCTLRKLHVEDAPPPPPAEAGLTDAAGNPPDKAGGGGGGDHSTSGAFAHAAAAAPRLHLLLHHHHHRHRHHRRRRAPNASLRARTLSLLLSAVAVLVFSRAAPAGTSGGSSGGGDPAAVPLEAWFGFAAAVALLAATFEEWGRLRRRKPPSNAGRQDVGRRRRRGAGVWRRWWGAPQAAGTVQEDLDLSV
ncbi:hypothetical protein HK405_003099 [Cladochytrium tenue]|nr:hypothetical protein HK405_003099 [Cladochytrium tenue]